jgi:hypothetical protein
VRCCISVHHVMLMVFIAFPFLALNHRQARGLLWRLVFCMSSLCCILCFLLTLYATLKHWYHIQKMCGLLAPTQWLLCINPHLLVTFTSRFMCHMFLSTYILHLPCRHFWLKKCYYSLSDPPKTYFFTPWKMYCIFRPIVRTLRITRTPNFSAFLLKYR